MRILLTNDDGIFAKGILELAYKLTHEHELMIAAPSLEQSGRSHAFTMYEPLRCKEVRLMGLDDKVPCYAINGTPVDCVKLAIGNLSFQPDMIISGINHGDNLGTNVFYSATVAAAIEARMLNVPAMAVSCIASEPMHLDCAASVADNIIKKLNASGIKTDILLNVNVPDCTMNRLKGLRVTHLSFQEYELRYHERVDPRGGKYYWIPAEKTTRCDPEADNDERWTREGYATITPLKIDITDIDHMTGYKKLLGEDFV